MQDAVARGRIPGDEPSPGQNHFDADGALSRDFLVRRGRCCQEGCRNCPYGFRAHDVGATAGDNDVAYGLPPNVT